MSVTASVSEPLSEETRFGTRHTLTLVALLWTVALSPITGLLAGNAQARVAIHFHTTQIAWFTLGGALVGTFVVPFAMKAAALYGKRRVIVAVTAAGLIGDVIAAVATSYSTLLAGRIIAGAYGAAAAIAFAMARDVFPRRVVGTVSGALAGSAGIVALGGPFLSAWILDTWGFRGALWFMVVSTGVCLLLQLAFVPESPVREARTRMDWLGGLLLGGGLTAAVYGVGEGSAWGWTSGRLLAYVLAGAAAVVLFVVLESRLAHPLVPFALMRRRRIWTVLLATSVAAGAAYAVGTVTQLLTLMPRIPAVSDGLGWSVTRNAVITSPISVLIIVTAVGAGTLARRFDTRLMLATGAVLAAIGYLVAAEAHHSVAQWVVLGLIAGPGMGLIISSAPIMIIESVTAEEQVLANGTQFLLQGVAQVVISQLVFTVMARRGTVLQGTQFYHDAGFSDGFLLVAGCCAAGAVLVLLIPKPGARPAQ